MARKQPTVTIQTNPAERLVIELTQAVRPQNAAGMRGALGDRFVLSRAEIAAKLQEGQYRIAGNYKPLIMNGAIHQPDRAGGRPPQKTQEPQNSRTQKAEKGACHGDSD